MKIKVRKKDIGLVLLFALLFTSLSQGGMLKYIVLLAAAVICIIIAKNRIVMADMYVLIPALVYICFGMIASITNGFISSNSLKWALFLLIPSVTAVGIYEVFRKRNEDVTIYAFWGIVAANIPLLLHISAGDLAESQYAFIYGAYFLYFFYRRKWGYWCICLILLFLAHKRIATAAAVVCMAVMILPVIFKKDKYIKYFTALIVIALMLIPHIYVLMTDNGFIYKAFESLSIETNGRLNMWEKFAEYYNYSIWYLGNGIGWVYNRLEALNDPNFALLHNDLLTAYIEIGFVGFTCWLISYLYVAKKMAKNSIVFLFLLAEICYTIINYLTDNILIYINYWFPLNLIFLKVTEEKPEAHYSLLSYSANNRKAKSI